MVKCLLYVCFVSISPCLINTSAIAQSNKNADTIKGIWYEPNERMAEFPGGIKAFGDFLTQNLHYTGNLKGRVIVMFIIEKDGSLTNIKILRNNVDEAAGKEALRVINLSPKWTPGMQNDKPIRQQYVVPVSFNLPVK